MKKIVIGIAIGIILASAALIPLLIHERKAKFQFGLTNGRIQGQIDCAIVLDKAFGRYDGKSEYERLLSVKTTDIITIETNGVKTVRIIP